MECSLRTLALFGFLTGCASGAAAAVGGGPDIGESNVGFQSKVFSDRTDAGCDGGISVADRCAVCNPSKPRDCYERCIAGSGDSCALDGFKRSNLAEAAELYERACALGSGSGCELRARALARGEGVARNVAEGMNLFEQMCSVGRGFSCSNFALGLLRGEGRPRDTDAADRFLERACDLGDQTGCQLLREPERASAVDTALRSARSRVIGCTLGNNPEDCAPSDGGTVIKQR
jgi:hypothetical protein